jgi:hypothetical protein
MPDNASYMVAAYVVAAVVYLAYTVRLFHRAIAALRDSSR